MGHVTIFHQNSLELVNLREMKEIWNVRHFTHFCVSLIDHRESKVKMYVQNVQCFGGLVRTGLSMQSLPTRQITVIDVRSSTKR